jgi:hypothetical protein
MQDTVKKIMDDWWSFTLTDATEVSDKLISMHYKNMEACQIERIQDDKQNWCLANPEQCVGLQGMVENVWNNSPAIISKAMDLYDIVATDDVCFSDQELLEEVERATNDVSSILSSAWGFDLKWDQTR